VEYGEHGTTNGILLGQEAAEELLNLVVLPRRYGHDHYGCVEGPKRLHAEQLQSYPALGEVFHGAEGGFGGRSQVPGRAGGTSGATDHLEVIQVGELDFREALAGLGAPEAEIVKPQALA